MGDPVAPAFEWPTLWWLALMSAMRNSRSLSHLSYPWGDSPRTLRRPSSMSAFFIQFSSEPSEIPKSFAIWLSGAWPRRATATTSSRNSWG